MTAPDRVMCPVCGQLYEGPRLNPDERMCSPLSCSAWQYVAELPKVGSEKYRVKTLAEKMTIKGQG